MLLFFLVSLAPLLGKRNPLRGLVPLRIRKDFASTIRARKLLPFARTFQEIQTRVNAEKSVPDANLTHANAKFTNALGKLDPTNPKAVADFITAVAAPFATKTAVSNVLRDVGQARPRPAA